VEQYVLQTFGSSFKSVWSLIQPVVLIFKKNKLLTMKAIFSVLCLLCIQISNAQKAALPILTNFNKVRDFTIGQNQSEAYFTAQSPNEELSGIFKTIKVKGKWKEATLVSFSGQFKDLEPFLSPDRLQLYFASNRPLSVSESKTKDFDIWVVERKTIADDWSAPRNLGTPINSEHNEFYLSIANSKNMYFTSDRPSAKGKDDIFLSEWKNGNYQDAISLSSAINTESYEYNAYIAPDESFILFGGYKRKDGLGSGDLYISYKEDGKWSLAKNMGDTINSKYMDYCPFVDWKTKTLYFTSKISILKADKKLNSSEFLNEVNSYNNGLSRIYKVDISTLLNELK